MLLGAVQAAVADTPYSRWTLHLAYHDITQIVASGNQLYGLYNGNLLSYNIDDHTVQFIDKSNRLSDKGIQMMQYAEDEKCLVLVYQNKNVDFVYDDGTVVNIPQIKNYTEVEIRPISLTVNQEWAVIATHEGVVVLNIPHAEVKGFYKIGKEVNKAAVVGNQVYALIGNDLYRGDMKDNLYDFSQWVKASDVPTNDILPFDNGLYQLVKAIPGLDSSLLGAFYLREPKGKEMNDKVKVTNIWVVNSYRSNGMVQMISPNHMVYVDGAEPEKMQGFVQMSGNFVSLTATTEGSYWLIDPQNVLHRYEIDAEEKRLIESERDVEVGQYGPRRDLCYKLNYVGNRLLVAGGRMDYATGREYPPTAMYYENDTWKSLPETGFTLEQNGRYRNVLSVAQKSDNSSDFYVATMSGLLHFKDDVFVEQFHPKNSTLNFAKGLDGNYNYVIVDGLCFDPSGNLWMTNYETNKTIHVLKKDGSWKAFYHTQFMNVATPENLLIGKNGQIWVTSRRSTGLGFSGIFSLDVDGSIDDESDDRCLFRSSAPNQDGTECKFEQVNALCEDLNGQIWIGCGNGVYAVTRPENWFSYDAFRIYQPKVPRNDGTNLADYLLTGVNVTAITVDAGNRKWIGTMESGIYVVSPDGSELIEHISMENAPILSNTIFSLAFHPTTGELMIGTDVGLCSYQTHISPALQSMDKNTVKVYPNPVRPEFHGKVVIEGLTDGAEVKIVSTGSQLVARGNAVGGAFEWDVCNMMNGERVASGVYYVLAASVNGGGNAVAKIVVI